MKFNFNLRVPLTLKPLPTRKRAWLTFYESDCASRLAVHDCLVEMAYKEAGTSHTICHSDGSADEVRRLLRLLPVPPPKSTNTKCRRIGILDVISCSTS